MKKLNKIVIVIFALLLSACGPTPPSEADGWEYDKETESYIRETYFSRDDEITKEYLKQLEGTFTAEEDSSVGIIVENNEILVGIGTGSNVYPVEDYELFLWETYKEDSEEIAEIYIVVLSPPAILDDVVTRMNMYTVDKDLSARENPIFLFKVVGSPSVAGDYYMNRSNVEYPRVPSESSQQNNYLKEKFEEPDSELAELGYIDGTYQARVEGHNGPLSVEVTFIDSKFAEVEVIDHAETLGLVDSAIEEVPEAIVKNNSTNVDTVSGATVTSEAIIEAAIEAKKQAESNPMHESAGSGPKESPQELSLKSMRDLAKEYVDEWNGYDNTLLEEDWTDDGVWRYYMFQDGPTQHMVGVIVHSETGEVRGDYGGID